MRKLMIIFLFIISVPIFSQDSNSLSSVVSQLDIASSHFELSSKYYNEGKTIKGHREYDIANKIVNTTLYIGKIIRTDAKYKFIKKGNNVFIHGPSIEDVSFCYLEMKYLQKKYYNDSTNDDMIEKIEDLKEGDIFDGTIKITRYHCTLGDNYDNQSYSLGGDKNNSILIGSKILSIKKIINPEVIKKPEVNKETEGNINNDENQDEEGSVD